MPQKNCSASQSYSSLSAKCGWGQRLNQSILKSRPKGKWKEGGERKRRAWVEARGALRDPRRLSRHAGPAGRLHTPPSGASARCGAETACSRNRAAPWAAGRCQLSVSAVAPSASQAAIPGRRARSGRNRRTVSPRRSAGWRSGTEEPSGWVSSEAPLLARSDLFFFFPCVATWLSLCVCLSKPPLLLRTRVLLDEGPPERLRFTSITSLETLPPSTVASEALGSGLPRVNCRGLGTTQPLTDTWLCDLRGSTG